MILCLEDFINCINAHKRDLKSPRNINLMNFKRFLGDENFNPAGVLKDYIYLEAHSFFHYAKMLKHQKSKSMPELPNYLKELKNFRDKMIAHRDFNEKIKFPEGWYKLQQEINKLIPIKDLIKDVNNYYQEVIKK